MIISINHIFDSMGFLLFDFNSCPLFYVCQKRVEEPECERERVCVCIGVYYLQRLNHSQNCWYYWQAYTHAHSIEWEKSIRYYCHSHCDTVYENVFNIVHPFSSLSFSPHSYFHVFLASIPVPCQPMFAEFIQFAFRINKVADWSACVICAHDWIEMLYSHYTPFAYFQFESKFFIT